MRTTILIELTGEIRDIRVSEQVHHKICLIQSRSGKKSKGESIEKKKTSNPTQYYTTTRTIHVR